MNMKFIFQMHIYFSEIKNKFKLVNIIHFINTFRRDYINEKQLVFGFGTKQKFGTFSS